MTARKVPAELSDAEYKAQLAMDAELAAEMGLDRPYALGPAFGTCPGGSSYGHGMSLTTVHWGGCCRRWDEARQARLEALGA